LTGDNQENGPALHPGAAAKKEFDRLLLPDSLVCFV